MVETNVKALNPAQTADPLEAVIVRIQKAQMILAQPDTDGLRSAMVEPVLKLALGSLSEVYEKHRTRRRRKD